MYCSFFSLYVTSSKILFHVQFWLALLLLSLFLAMLALTSRSADGRPQFADGGL